MNKLEVIKNQQLDPMDTISTELIAMKEKNATNVLGYAIESQLTVIKSIYKANLMISCVDLILENLRLSINKCSNDNEKQEIQIIFAKTISSIVFFSEAKIYYETNKWEEEGIELFMKGWEGVASAIIQIIEMIGADSKNKSLSLANLLNIFTGNRDLIGNLIERIILSNKKQAHINTMRYEFYKFVHSLVQKLDKHSDLFGKSMILAGLIEKNMEYLINYDCKYDAHVNIYPTSEFINKKHMARNRYKELIRTFEGT